MCARFVFGLTRIRCKSNHLITVQRCAGTATPPTDLVRTSSPTTYIIQLATQSGSVVERCMTHRASLVLFCLAFAVIVAIVAGEYVGVLFR